jgi:glycosyltransferase involved in cell wall biosynthesis
VLRKKIAIVLSRFPYPLNKGDKLRAYHQIVFLSKENDIYLYCLNDEIVNKHDLDEMNKYCVEVQLFALKKCNIVWNLTLSFFKKWPAQVGYFFDAGIQKKIQASILELKPYVVYGQLARTAFYIKHLPFKRVIDFQDAFSTNYIRIAENSTFLKKLFYHRESKLMKSFEQNMLSWFDASTIISDFDKGQVAKENKHLVVVSNGVDTHYFSSTPKEKKFDLLFCGNLSYLPNKNAVIFLCEKIAPLLIDKIPTIKINIVGGNSINDFKKYESKNIHFAGWVDDVRTAYNETKLFIAPLFTGAGLQNKLLEAMSMQVPCVASSITNASLKATENKQVLIANNEYEFVEKIIQLLNDEHLQNSFKINARTFVEENYSWDKANRILEDVLLK